jgi:hypothetical protein
LLAVIVAWLTAFVPSMLLAAAVSGLMPNVGQPKLDLSTGPAMFLVVIAAPLIETLIMAGVLAVLLRFVSPSVAVLTSSIGWGIAHSLAAPAWGLVIWWPFLIFSVLFVTWRERSLFAALAMPALVHMLQNAVPAATIYLAVKA